jgi:cytochrome c553
MMFRAVLLIVVVAVFAFAQTPAVAPEEAAKQAEEEKVSKKHINGICSTCHGADLIEGTRATRQEWLDILNNMNGKGAGLSETDLEMMANYLARKYPPK